MASFVGKNMNLHKCVVSSRRGYRKYEINRKFDKPKSVVFDSGCM